MSFPGRILSSTNIFGSAINFLTSPGTHNCSPSPSTSRVYYSDPLDEVDSSPPGATLRPWHSRDSSGELDPHGNGIPLISYSRTPSPSGRTRPRSATQSEDEDEAVPVSLRPLVGGTGHVSGSIYQHQGDAAGRGWWRRFTGSENFGGFLFGTWLGWQVYVGLLVVWSFTAGFLLVLMNRFILWTGTYKFPYPLAHTWIQLLFTHGFLILAASLTRLLAQPLRRLGLSSLIAPSYPVDTATIDFGSRKGIYRLNPLLLIFKKTGGIAGGGYLEFDRTTALDVAPLAIVYVGKTVLSNISYAYAALPLYTLSRIPSVPVMLILTALIGRTDHSTSTLSSALVITINLLIASIRSSDRLIWEAIVAGVFSALFVALYPILLLRTHKKLIFRQSPSASSISTPHGLQTREDSRAYWSLLHYTSLLSLIFLTPLLLISGEIPNILHNCYFLDVPWFWFLSMLGGLASFAVFAVTLAFVRATSPLTEEVVKLPRSAAQMMILERFKLPVHAWVGVALVYAASLWYTWIRRDEGRRYEMRRIGSARR